MRYGREPEVLKDISFVLQRGSFHFLTGPSGSGKSTLLKLIYLAERASRGRIEIFGQDLALLKRKDRPMMRRRIGVVFQEFRLLDHLSVFDNAALPPASPAASPPPIAATSRTCWAGSVSASGCTPCPRRCRAARSSGWPSPGR